MNKTISPSDIFEIRQMSLVSELDKQILMDFYAPIIGMRSFALYTFLLDLRRKSINSFDKLLNRTAMTIKEISDSFSSLEALGLVDSYLSEKDGVSYYIFCLYSPKMPNEFLKNPFLLQLLLSMVGEEGIRSLAKKYDLDDVPPAGYKRISTSFKEYFNPDSTSTLPRSVLDLVSGTKKTREIGEMIDFNKLLAELHKIDHRFMRESFSEEELLKISSSASLFGVSYEDVAFAITDSFDFDKRIGARLDVNTFSSSLLSKNKIPSLSTPSISDLNVNELGDSRNALFLKDMETIRPVQYLCKLQGNHKPSSYDLRIIMMLKNDIGLAEPAINALISYVLQNNNNILAKGLCEMLGAELVRAKISSSIDTINYLKNRKKTIASKKTNNYKNKDKRDIAPSYIKNEGKEEEMSDEEFKKMMEDIAK
ncbi:MAG: hypothetical protein IJ247_00580 [Bacilli bacterium]|nr:hypothetical protein [Bacilli bacterium]